MTDSDQQFKHKIESAEQGQVIDMSEVAVEERWNRVWHLTVEAWAKKGIDITEAPMRRDVERLTHLHDQ
jgi:hypothetical protein